MDMANIISLLGLLGALIGGYAYFPQIRHLIVEKCSAGISGRAFMLWTVSSALVLTNAVYIQAGVFIFLCIIQLSASATILALSVKNRTHVCASHLHGENPLG